MVESKDKWSTFKKQEFKPKKLEDYDIDIKIIACGVCGSDVHMITGGWSAAMGDAPYPLCVGHEIIGHVVKIGPKVTTCNVGDRVGVGAQIWSCLDCKQCKSHNENYCPKQVDTYGAFYPDGTKSQGGYASHIRAHEYFTFKIPDALETIIAAPMLCAGLTTFSPLKRAGVKPGMKVAVVGLGGLGHFGVQFANALGADVYVLSHSPHKKDDALKLGAKEFILTSEEGWADKWSFEFDMILNTADATNKFKLADYFKTLTVHGKFWNVGLPDEPLPEIRAFDFAPNGAFIGGSHIGCREECQEMLQLAADKGLKGWVETISISEEGCKQAVERLNKGDVKFRFTLVDFDKAFPNA